MRLWRFWSEIEEEATNYLTTFLLEPCCWMGLPAVDGPVPNTTAVAPEGEMGWVAWAKGRVTTRVPTPPACEYDVEWVPENPGEVTCHGVGTEGPKIGSDGHTYPYHVRVN